MKKFTLLAAMFVALFATSAVSAQIGSTDDGDSSAGQPNTVDTGFYVTEEGKFSFDSAFGESPEFLLAYVTGASFGEASFTESGRFGMTLEDVDETHRVDVYAYDMSGKLVAFNVMVDPSTEMVTTHFWRNFLDENGNAVPFDTTAENADYVEMLLVEGEQLPDTVEQLRHEGEGEGEGEGEVVVGQHPEFGDIYHANGVTYVRRLVNGHPVCWVVPFPNDTGGTTGGTDLDEFIEILVSVAQNDTANFRHRCWERDIECPDGCTGFDPDLTAGGQGTDVYRHILCGTGSGMNTGFFGYCQFFIVDGFETFCDGSDENHAEMHGDIVGVALGQQIKPAFNDGVITDEEADIIREILREYLGPRQ